jgi:hypothetical protein
MKDSDKRNAGSSAALTGLLSVLMQKRGLESVLNSLSQEQISDLIDLTAERFTFIAESMAREREQASARVESAVEPAKPPASVPAPPSVPPVQVVPPPPVAVAPPIPVSSPKPEPPAPASSPKPETKAAEPVAPLQSSKPEPVLPEPVVPAKSPKPETRVAPEPPAPVSKPKPETKAAEPVAPLQSSKPESLTPRIPESPNVGIVFEAERSVRPQSPAPHAESAPGTEMPSDSKPQYPVHEEDTEPVPPRITKIQRTRHDVTEEGVFYLHAAAAADGAPIPFPYSLEEKGIDGRRFAFCWETGGIRYYLSNFHEEGAAIARGGSLLMKKQDAVRLRGVHEGLVNDFRLHGLLVPFEFGLAINGWEDTQKMLIDLAPVALGRLEDLGKTKTWRVIVNALDARFAELQKNDTVEKRREMDRHRSSYSSVAGTQKSDVKMLERVINRQIRLVDSIHAEILPLADKGVITSRVTLQSGSSEDWKCILDASYDVRPTVFTRFFRVVTDLQYQHLLLELMIKLEGDCLPLTLLEPS